MQAIHASLKKRHCVTLMAHIVPVVIDIMMAHPEAVWGEACYPVVTS